MSATYTTVHSNARSLTHWARPEIKPGSSWILVGFITTEPRQQLLPFFKKKKKKVIFFNFEGQDAHWINYSSGGVQKDNYKPEKLMSEPHVFLHQILPPMNLDKQETNQTCQILRTVPGRAM